VRGKGLEKEKVGRSIALTMPAFVDASLNFNKLSDIAHSTVISRTLIADAS